MDKIERCNELQDFIDTLNKLNDRICSSDLKGELEDLIGEYYGEYKKLDDELIEEEENERLYLESEYRRSVI